MKNCPRSTVYIPVISLCNRGGNSSHGKGRRGKTPVKLPPTQASSVICPLRMLHSAFTFKDELRTCLFFSPYVRCECKCVHTFYAWMYSYCFLNDVVAAAMLQGLWLMSLLIPFIMWMSISESSSRRYRYTENMFASDIDIRTIPIFDTGTSKLSFSIPTHT